MWFLLVWGKRVREKRLGYVADYCPICRKVGPYEAMEQRMAAHFWFIPFERGNRVGATRFCLGCRTESKFHPGQYGTFSQSDRGSLEALIATTFPDVREVHKERLAIDEMVTSNGATLDPAMRQKLILQAFGMAEPHFQSGLGHQGRHILTVTMRTLRPTEEEIRAGLARFQGTRSRMGRLLSVNEVLVLVYPELEVKKPGQYSY